MREWIPGEVVRYWDGGAYRIGRYLRTIERGKHKNKRLVSVRAWGSDKGWHNKHVRVRPDHVTRLDK